jgi:hypothetical protein
MKWYLWAKPLGEANLWLALLFHVFSFAYPSALYLSDFSNKHMLGVWGGEDT